MGDSGLAVQAGKSELTMEESEGEECPSGEDSPASVEGQPPCQEGRRLGGRKKKASPNCIRISEFKRTQKEGSRVCLDLQGENGGSSGHPTSLVLRCPVICWSDWI